MKKKACALLRHSILGTCLWLILTSCSSAQYDVTQPPDYDNLIGKKFSEAVFKGRQVYKKIGETDVLEELENRRSDGCILVFGVRKMDDVIEYWRVDSGPGTCLTSRKSLNL